jgi:hypothetical protein
VSSASAGVLLEDIIGRETAYDQSATNKNGALVGYLARMSYTMEMLTKPTTTLTGYASNETSETNDNSDVTQLQRCTIL